MRRLGYYNGAYGELEEMTVPMGDRGGYFGDGVYDATYSRNYRIFALEEHIDRFFNSAALLKINLRHTKQEIAGILQEMVQKMDTGNNLLYWQATRGTAVRSHVFPEGESNLWIMIIPKEIEPVYKKVRLTTMEDTRFLHCNIKTLNLIPNVIASERAKQLGCDETVFHRGERVTECAHSNVHIIKDGIFRTAPTDHYILPGIARAHLIRACKALGYGVDEHPFTVAEMMDADEVIVTASGSLCLAAEAIDGKKVGGKAPEMRKALQDYVLKEFLQATE